MPYLPRPVHFADRAAWQRWLVTDQRFVADRPDVLTYVTAPLSAPLHIGGAPVVNLFASTSGTDSDWVVKLIDVYPTKCPPTCRCRATSCRSPWTSSAAATARASSSPPRIPANKVLPYRFALPQVNHVFLPGHRLMVQIQSSWFPLYDRNPQTYVANIFLAATGRLPQGDAAGVSLRGQRPRSSTCRWSATDGQGQPRLGGCRFGRSPCRKSASSPPVGRPIMGPGVLPYSGLP